VAAGNIGRPVSDVALDPESPGWVVIEVSSFQLHDMSRVRARVGVLSNLAPDHLDRYVSLEAYHADKQRLFRLGTPDATWVTNADDRLVQGLARGAPGSHRRFASAETADGWYDRSANRLILGSEGVIARDELPRLSDHNVADAYALARFAEASAQPLEQQTKRLREMLRKVEGSDPWT